MLGLEGVHELTDTGGGDTIERSLSTPVTVVPALLVQFILGVELSSTGSADSNIHLGVCAVPDNRCPLMNVLGLSEGTGDMLTKILFEFLGLPLPFLEFLSLLKEHLVVSFSCQLFLGLDDLARLRGFEDSRCQFCGGFSSLLLSLLVLLLQRHDDGQKLFRRKGLRGGVDSLNEFSGIGDFSNR